MKTISVVIPTYNEEENVVAIAHAVLREFATSLPAYQCELLFIDNASTDATQENIEKLCLAHSQIKAIFNAGNFGQFASPYYGLCQASGDCAILLCADFQDPVSVLPKLVSAWEMGASVVCAVKSDSMESRGMRFLRTCYYKLIRRFSQVAQIEHFTGFGLYDRSFLNLLQNLKEPYPFLRSIVAEYAPHARRVPYTQAKRAAGKSHNNFFTLYDAAMQGFTGYTKLPIRFCVLLGVVLGVGGVIGAVCAAVLRSVHLALAAWGGILGGAILWGIGMVGEYLLSLKRKIGNRPMVIEARRIGFEKKEK